MKWQIIEDTARADTDSFALESLTALIHEYAGYWPGIGPEDPQFSGIRLRIASPWDGVPAHGYRVRVCEPEDGRQLVELIGADDAALLHCCMDFCGQYISKARLSHTVAKPYYFQPLFTEKPLPAADYARAPRIANRGLWTWGISVYDWREYLRNMARLRLNELIIWNDFAPVNGREIVRYAHSLGIRLIWGYAWGWDTTMRLDVSQQAVDDIIERYEREYAALGGDGIYFQSFTETREETLDGRLIAEAVVEFVNRTAGQLLERHPGLRLQFGLHSESVKNRLEYIARVDPRVELIWENCGSFPYSRTPNDTAGFEETLAFTDSIIRLRPDAATGAVLKSQTQLDWPRFEHQTGPAMLGCASEAAIQARLPLKRDIWRYVEDEWLDHGEMCDEVLRRFAAWPKASVYELVDDGLFERCIPRSLVMFADGCWSEA